MGNVDSSKYMVVCWREASHEQIAEVDTLPEARDAALEHYKSNPQSGDVAYSIIASRSYVKLDGEQYTEEHEHAHYTKDELEYMAGTKKA